MGPVVENSISVVPKEPNKVTKSKLVKSQGGKKLQQQLSKRISPTQKTLSSNAEAFVPSTSTPKKTNEDCKDILRNTTADKVLETFQCRYLTTNEWNKLEDQLLTRGVQ